MTVPRSIVFAVVVVVVGGMAVGCGDDGPTVDWTFPDACDAGPPDEACYVSKRDPASDNVALATEIALGYMEWQPPEALPWDWGEATLMFSLGELYRITGETRLRDYYQAWLDWHIAEGYDIQWSDHCPPALTALALLKDIGGAGYQQVIDDVLTYLMEIAPRSPEGGISHMGTFDIFGETLWLDSLFMFGVLLTRWGEYTGDPLYLDEIGVQFWIFAELLQEELGFLVHAYNWPSRQDPDVYWGRGNGWVTYAGYEYLRARKVRGEWDKVVSSILSRQVAAIVQTQDSDTGMWWTVLNRPGETYLETSVTALFAAGLARGYRYGYLDETVLPTIERAMDGVASMIVDDASGVPVVTGISGPTTAGDFHNYETVRVEDNLSYGVGAVILALIETSGLP